MNKTPTIQSKGKISRASSILLVGMFALGAASAQEARISFLENLQFSSVDGASVLVGAGDWVVEPAGKEELRLTPLFGGLPVQIAAESGRHEVDTSAPLAQWIQSEVGTDHLLLFLPDGRVLEAVSMQPAVVSRGRNRRVQENDPSIHGETDAFRRSGRQKSYRGTTMVTTLAPCWYCSGLIRQFGIGRVVVGESENFDGGIDWLREIGVEVVEMGSAECVKMLRDFISDHPDVWNEDIGEEGDGE